MLGICALIAVIAVVIGSAAAFAGNDRKLPIYCVETEKKQIAISFDAAWGNDDTQTLIDILKEYNVPATFFVVGSWVDKYPESVKALSDAGHQVQNHSNTHPHMPQLSKHQMRDELESCNSKIKAIKMLDYLDEYTNFHFQEEEELQKKVSYPEFSGHHAKHEEFKTSIQELYDYLNENEGPDDQFIEQVKRNVVDWLFQHIKTFDRSVAEYIHLKDNSNRL